MVRESQAGVIDGPRTAAIGATAFDCTCRWFADSATAGVDGTSGSEATAWISAGVGATATAGVLATAWRCAAIAGGPLFSATASGDPAAAPSCRADGCRTATGAAGGARGFGEAAGSRGTRTTHECAGRAEEFAGAARQFSCADPHCDRSRAAIASRDAARLAGPGDR